MLRCYQKQWKTIHFNPKVTETHQIITILTIRDTSSNLRPTFSISLPLKKTTIAYFFYFLMWGKKGGKKGWPEVGGGSPEGLNNYDVIGFGHYGLGRYCFPLVLITSPYRTLLLHWFRTRWIWKVLFSLCSDNMSACNLIRTT